MTTDEWFIDRKRWPDTCLWHTANCPCAASVNISDEWKQTYYSLRNLRLTAQKLGTQSYSVEWVAQNKNMWLLVLKCITMRECKKKLKTRKYGS